jgi:Protein of unknown function (DUF1579)
MKRITLTICTVLVTVICCKVSAQSEAEMKAWMEYMTPGDIHKMLAKSDGEWNEEISMWMAPGTPVQKNTATCVNKMILGGRYQTSAHTGSFNGMPFEGISTVAYDNAKKKFITTWVDNMGTGIMVMEGNWDDKTKTLHTKGKQTDPMSGKDMDVRETFQIIDDNTQKIEMFMTPAGGKEFKSMEILFTRKK